ncbi:MAG: hypothetical protein H6821_05190 [Planctomycetaceae bacterium]|nr:hypothetical protein [Planctomycetaceae bacterium]
MVSLSTAVKYPYIRGALIDLWKVPAPIILILWMLEEPGGRSVAKTLADGSRQGGLTL